MKEIRQIRVKEGLAFVPLTKGFEAVIDASDIHLVIGYNWNVMEVKRKDGSIYVRYAIRAENKKPILMHRVISGSPSGLDVDHKDSDGLNNTRTNLRIATRHQNMANRRTNVNNKSGVKGVWWCKRREKWRVGISLMGKTIMLGEFKNIDDAAKAYREKSEILYGEFAR